MIGSVMVAERWMGRNRWMGGAGRDQEGGIGTAAKGRGADSDDLGRPCRIDPSGPLWMMLRMMFCLQMWICMKSRWGCC